MLVGVPIVQAGVYSTLEPPPFDFDAQGLPIALSSSGYASKLATVQEAGIEPFTPNPQSLRGRYLKRITEFQQRGEESLTPEERADLGGALIRLRRTDKAFDWLRQASRERNADFFTWTHLAAVCAVKEQWPAAMEAQQIGKGEFPEMLFDYPPAQRDWYRRVERDYLTKWLKLRAGERRVTGFGGNVVEQVDAIFGTIDWGDATGNYLAGSLAESERAKLPPDALAIAQQLSIWAPDDTRLFWLVGELYNVNGDLPAAIRIMDACVDSRRYNNDNLSKHRHMLKEALALQIAQKEAADAIAWRPPTSRLLMVGVVAVPLLLLLFGWQLREWFGRKHRG